MPTAPPNSLALLGRVADAQNRRAENRTKYPKAPVPNEVKAAQKMAQPSTLPVAPPPVSTPRMASGPATPHPQSDNVGLRPPPQGGRFGEMTSPLVGEVAERSEAGGGKRQETPTASLSEAERRRERLLMQAALGRAAPALNPDDHDMLMCSCSVGFA